MNNHFHLKDVSAINIKNKLDSTLGEPASSFITVKQWVAGSMEDQILVKTNYKIALDHNLAEIADIPKSTVNCIITKNLFGPRRSVFECLAIF